MVTDNSLHLKCSFRLFLIYFQAFLFCDDMKCWLPQFIFSIIVLFVNFSCPEYFLSPQHFTLLHNWYINSQNVSNIITLTASIFTYKEWCLHDCWVIKEKARTGTGSSTTFDISRWSAVTTVNVQTQGIVFTVTPWITANANETLGQLKMAQTYKRWHR